MLKNQKGFSHVIVPVLLLIVLAGVGVFAFNRIHRTDDGNSQGMFASKNYNLSFDGKSDNNYQYQYSIDVFYDDSFDPKSECPSRLDSFKGKVSIAYQSDSKAKVEVLQNVKPYKKQDGSISGAICPAVVVPPATETLRFDKKWIEAGSTDKTVLVNDKTYSLALNKQDRTINFSGESYKRTQPYLPDGLAQLYARNLMNNDCIMSVAQIQAYAQQHSIVTADSKYPNLTAEIKAIPNLKLEDPYGSENVLLVIADDYVKQLVEKTRNERGVQDNCHVVASKPVYTFISP